MSTPVKLDPVGMHAMLDVGIDVAQNDLDGAGGHGISMQCANGPGFSFVIIAGDHSVYTPKQLATAAIDIIDAMVKFQGAVVHDRAGLSPEETKRRIEELLAPKKPGVN